MNPLVDLSGKVAIVTGAASFHRGHGVEIPGMGVVSARLFSELGATVVLADINRDAAEIQAATIRQAGGRALAVGTDVSDERQVQRMIEATIIEYGRLDVLLNNASPMNVLYEEGDPDITQFEVETWRKLTDVILLGSMLCCKHAIPRMIETGGGSIVCTSSIAGMAGNLRQTMYGAAKAGVGNLVRSISTQWGKEGIRANAVAPGMFLSPSSLDAGTDVMDEYLRQADTPFLGEPIDTARVAAFLASDAARYVTAQVIKVDGGLTEHTPTVTWQRSVAWQHE